MQCGQPCGFVSCVCSLSCLSSTVATFILRSTAHNIISPLLDQRTREKVRILGSNYHLALEKVIAPAQLPLRRHPFGQTACLHTVAIRSTSIPITSLLVLPQSLLTVHLEGLLSLPPQLRNKTRSHPSVRRHLLLNNHNNLKVTYTV